MIEKASALYYSRSLKGRFTGRCTGICMVLLAIFFAAPARGQVFFSDLGTGSNVYNTITGYAIAGSSSVEGASYAQANLFQTVAGGYVSQIDLAVSNFSGSTAFYASIYTDAGGVPGTRVSGAYWGVTTFPLSAGNCCELADIPLISGVVLAPDTNYFMVLGPLIATDNSFNVWDWNTVGATGIDLFSENGGPWTQPFATTLGAFEIEGSPTPEPSSFVLCLFGIAGGIGAMQVRRRKRIPLAGI
jgi:hypothetical protein